MVRLACFGNPELQDDVDNISHRSGESAPPHRDGQKLLRRGHSLFSHKRRVLTRDAAKIQFKKVLQNIKRDHHPDKDRHINDGEFIILGKIYSEDTSVDLNSIATNGSTLSHLLPFILNTLLYGFHDRTAGSGVGSSRSGKRSALLKIARDPKDISLDATAHLVKAQCERQVETFLYQQAMNSVSFALECVWYINVSLHIGPKDAYHRTMTMLLGMESVLANSAPPGDLFKKAEVTEAPSGPSGSYVQSKDDEVEKVTPPFRRSSVTRAVDLDISGSGENDHRMHFNALQLADEVKLKQWLEARRERANLFHAEMDFVKCLTHISNGLFDVQRELRRDVLRRELEKLNDYIPSNVFIPTERRPHRVLRIVPEEAHVFNTKERVPYLLVVEVEDIIASAPEKEHPVDDHRASSPLRRIGSLSASQIGKHAQPSQDPFEPEVPMQNQPADKFEFSPDVTPDVRHTGVDLMKRESSFRVDASFDDDKRPPDEELLKALGERWAVKSERLRTSSKFGSNPNWRLVSCIVKARDQLRQEMLAQRLIQEFSRIFERANIPCWLRPYEIISTSGDCGLIETVTDAKSIDSIKKYSRNVTTLQDYFVGVFGGRGSQRHKRAVRNFVHSMAGYSVVQYLMNIKDRHNGNLMIDADGHIVHIDFGFLLSNSPGGNMEFEKAPFKLTEEMVQVMGGSNSGAFKLYRKLCIHGYLEACRYVNKILLMVDTMYPGNESMPCFLQGREYVLANLRDRLGFELSRKDKVQRMSKLIDYARGNWTTRAYDHFQKVSMGISK
ncbi:unnamed protein product [Agarophyton chilense]|eukprot:gb/GEZJ01000247.1/.p1 GENE.gb/GEZJ01000247.1/~~gb/GEZJ01000247.1/.p1  ORF type:complete len:785 (-),score=117.02 gb/GEZJ01000247.1/:1492-3846(-)